MNAGDLAAYRRARAWRMEATRGAGRQHRVVEYATDPADGTGFARNTVWHCRCGWSHQVATAQPPARRYAALRTALRAHLEGG